MSLLKFVLATHVLEVLELHFLINMMGVLVFITLRYAVIQLLLITNTLKVQKKKSLFGCINGDQPKYDINEQSIQSSVSIRLLTMF